MPKPSRPEQNRLDIFSYLDYRAFLREAFEAMRGRNPRLSYRSFAAKAGLTTPNFLQQVIGGRRKLGASHIPAVARVLGLDRPEAEFLRLLAAYGEAGTPDERNAHYRQILRNRRASSIKLLERGQYEYHSHWYHPAVRELATHPRHGGDPEWIAGRLFPRIPTVQVEQSLRLLERLGLLERNADSGPWRQRDAVLATGSEAAHLAAREYHRAAIQLAQDSIRHFPPDRRDIRSVTLSLSPEGFTELKALLEEYWRRLLDLSSRHADPEVVYQVNLQAFPLVKEKGRAHA